MCSVAAFSLSSLEMPAQCKSIFFNIKHKASTRNGGDGNKENRISLCALDIFGNEKRIGRCGLSGFLSTKVQSGKHFKMQL